SLRFASSTSWSVTHPLFRPALWDPCGDPAFAPGGARNDVRFQTLSKQVACEGYPTHAEVASPLSRRLFHDRDELILRMGSRLLRFHGSIRNYGSGVVPWNASDPPHDNPTRSGSRSRLTVPRAGCYALRLGARRTKMNAAIQAAIGAAGLERICRKVI